MSGKWHSKLVPYGEAIRVWRKAGKSYREIKELLLKEKGVEVHLDTINSFVLTRARAAKVGKLMAELPEPAPLPPMEVQSNGSPATGDRSGGQSVDASNSFFIAPSTTPKSPKERPYNLGF